MKRIACLALTLLSAAALALAQTSASYRLAESSFDFGGDPVNGAFAASSSYHVRLDALGGTAIATGLSSASYRADGGFVASYPPPGEVLGQNWTSNTTMACDPEGSVGSYGLYRDLVSTLPGGFGSCLQSPIATETATDSADPPVGAAWFYLVTARNTLLEEGTKGYESNGTERSNPSPCP